MAQNKTLNCLGGKKIIIKKKRESEGTDQIWCFILGQLNNTRAETAVVSAQ